MTPPASAWGSPTTWRSRTASSLRHRRTDRRRTHTTWCGSIGLLALCAHPLWAKPSSVVVDQIGEVVRPGTVRRVVPLAPDVTELVFAIGAGSLVVAVTPAADFPPAAARLPRVAPNDTEAIVALKPDLVLATTAGSDARVVERLRQLGTRVFTVDVTSLARLADACRLVGEVVGRSAGGGRLAREIEQRSALATAKARTLPRRNALYVVWWEPLIVAAPGSFHDDMLRRAGLANLAPASAGRYPRVAPEMLLDPELQVVVVPDEHDLRQGFERVLASPAGAKLASGALQVIWLPADLANRPGPRLPVALEKLVATRERIEKQGSASPPTTDMQTPPKKGLSR